MIDTIALHRWEENRSFLWSDAHSVVKKYNILAVYNNNIKNTIYYFHYFDRRQWRRRLRFVSGPRRFVFFLPILDKTWWSDDASVRQETPRRVVERQTSSRKMDNRLPGRGQLYRIGADGHKNSRRQVKKRKRPDRCTQFTYYNINNNNNN